MNEFVARNGLIALDNSIVTGSLTVTNGITGSLSGSHVGDTTGTASWAQNVISSSYALTASFALNAGTSTATGDKITTGSVTASVDINGDTFRIISGSSTFLYVSSSGRVGIGTSSIYPQAKLDVDGDLVIAQQNWAIRGNNSSADFAIEELGGSAFNDNNIRLYIRTGGNVGIGTGGTLPTSKLQVSGTVNVVNFRGSGSVATSSIFTVDGAAGRLFSVNDSLSGSLFSVNTIAGLPVIEAFSDNTVRIGQFGQRALFVSQSRVGVGKETLLNANIDVSGSAIITGSLNVTGSITTTGTITATTLVVQVITSSTDFITGSTRFGSSVTNTHVFTGSVNISGSSHSIIGITNITGSVNVSGSSHSIIGITNITGSLDVSGSGHDIVGNTTITGSFSYSGSITINSGSIKISSGSILTPKVLGSTATPTIAAGGAAGVTPTISISGSDVAGYIRVLTGTATTANNPIVTVTFASAYASLPYVLTSPANFSASFVAGGISGAFTTASTTGFTIFSGNGALRGTQAYTWSYHVFGNG
jgi:hypothetical protein